jgi:nicotinic acid phosphoribosyltransferase
LFVRKSPRNRSYPVAGGLEHVYFLMSVRFNETELSYLKSLEVLSNVAEDFFEYLRNFTALSKIVTDNTNVQRQNLRSVS